MSESGETDGPTGPYFSTNANRQYEPRQYQDRTTRESTTTTTKETLKQLEARCDAKVRAQNAKSGAGDNQFGVKLGDIRKLRSVVFVRAADWLNSYVIAKHADKEAVARHPSLRSGSTKW